MNQALVLRNWLVGAYIVEFEQRGMDRARYGTKLLPRLANDLEKRDISGLGLSTLKSARQFYFCYPQIGQTVSGYLDRSTIKGQKGQPLVGFFEGFVSETQIGQPPVGQSASGFVAIPPPTVTEAADLLPATISTPRVKNSVAPLITPLSARSVLLFSWTRFEARQKRITVGNKHDYIDLVFYQRRLRCHVLLDLKIRAFQHSDAGQMNFYLNWWKEHGMEAGDNPPAGIILCSDRDRTEVEYATAGIANRLFVSRYLTALPSAEQLRQFLEKDRDRVEALIPRTQKNPRRPRRKK